MIQTTFHAQRLDEFTEAKRQDALRKLAGLDRAVPLLDRLAVHLSREGAYVQARLIARLPRGKAVAAQGQDRDLEAALGGAIEALKRQLVTHKEKRAPRKTPNGAG